MYTIIVSGVSFSLSEASIRSDSPDTNLLAMSLLGDFAEAQERKLVLDRNPTTFKVIRDHLAGYTVFPLVAADYPDTDKTKFLRFLMDDCEYYGLQELRAIVRREMASEQTCTAAQIRSQYVDKIATWELHMKTVQQAVTSLGVLRTNFEGQLAGASVRFPTERQTIVQEKLGEVKQKIQALSDRLTGLQSDPPAPDDYFVS